jgi:hypothetical protein
VADHDLQLYLKTLHNQLSTVALHPEPGQMVRSLLLRGRRACVPLWPGCGAVGARAHCRCRPSEGWGSGGRSGAAGARVVVHVACA